MNKTTFLISLLCGSASISALAENNMYKVLEAQNITQCNEEIISLADSVIGTKPHRILGHKHQGSDNETLFTATMALSYRDRESLVFFAADISGKSCSVRYSESYALQVPCNMARQEVFKKWEPLGKLNNNNTVLRSKRRPTQQAFLSTALTNSGCLINITDYYQASKDNQ